MTKCSELWAKVTLFTEERIRQINHEISWSTLANLSILAVKFFNNHRDILEQVSRSVHLKAEAGEFKPEDINSVCLILGSLPSLPSRLIGVIVDSFIKSFEHLQIGQCSKLYLSLARVASSYIKGSDPAAYQTYQHLISLMVDKILKSEKLELGDVLQLCLPLAQDGVSGDSKVWIKFRDTIFDN
jgi:hypothetical protein